MHGLQKSSAGSQHRALIVTGLGLLGALAALIVVTGLLARDVSRMSDAMQRESKLIVGRQQLVSVLLELTNAETGQRGYLLTGKQRYLAAYGEAVAALPVLLSQLDSLARDVPSLTGPVRQIQEQATLKLAELSQTLRLHQGGNKDAALALVQSDAGQQYMEQLRIGLGAMQVSLDGRRRAVSDQVLAGMSRTRRQATLAVAVLIAVIGLAAIQIRMLVRAQNRYAAELQSLTDILQHTTDYVAQTDREGRVRYINPAALRALGLPSRERVSQYKFEEFYSPETNRRWANEIIPAVKQTGAWLGTTQVLLQGQSVPVNHMVLAHRGASGRIARFSSVMRDISSEVAARWELDRQRAILDAIVEATPTSVVVWDADLRYLRVNQTFERWNGRHRDEYLNHTISEASGEEEYRRSLPWLRRALAGETVRYEKDFPNRPGSHHVMVTYLPLRLKDGSIIGVIGIGQDISGHREENLRLLLLSERDVLTGLLNRGGLETYLMKKINDGEGPSLAVLYIDLDYFKPINDQFGHAAGDEVLRQFASRLQRLVRPTDAVARLGGDEFAVVLCGILDPASATAIADKVVAMASEPFSVVERSVSVAASVGVACDAEAAGGWRNLVAQADAMTYVAKSQGRGRRAVAQGRDPLPTDVNRAGVTVF